MASFWPSQTRPETQLPLQNHHSLLPSAGLTCVIDLLGLTPPCHLPDHNFFPIKWFLNRNCKPDPSCLGVALSPRVFEGVEVNNKMLTQIISQIYGLSRDSLFLNSIFCPHILIFPEGYFLPWKCKHTLAMPNGFFFFFFLSFLFAFLLFFFSFWDGLLLSCPSWSWFPKLKCSATSAPQVGPDICHHTQPVLNLPTYTEAGVLLWATGDGGGASLLGCAGLTGVRRRGPDTQVSTGKEERELWRAGLASNRRNPSKDGSQERACHSVVTEFGHQKRIKSSIPLRRKEKLGRERLQNKRKSETLRTLAVFYLYGLFYSSMKLWSYGVRSVVGGLKWKVMCHFISRSRHPISYM